METETLIAFEKSLESITNDRQAFDHIAKGLLKQNAKSTDIYYDDGDEPFQSDECAYISVNIKSSETTRCAVGWLINKKHYLPEIEGRPAYDSDVEQIVLKSTPNWNRTEESMAMLLFAQRIHDGQNPEDWQKILSIANSKLFSIKAGSFKLNKIAIDTVGDDIIKSYKEERYFNTNYPNNEQEKAGK